MNKPIIISLIALVIVGFLVSRIKYEVVFLRNRLTKVNQDIEKYTDDLRVCKAEWAYLNDPQRLKRLCEKYLPNMAPMKTEQIKTFDEISKAQFVKISEDTTPEDLSKTSKKQVKIESKVEIKKNKRGKKASLGSLLSDQVIGYGEGI